MRTSKLLEAIDEIASNMGISTFLGDKSLIATTALEPRSLWILPPTVSHVDGTFDSEALYELELYYIEFIETEEEQICQMVDTMGRFAAEVAKHSSIECSSVRGIEPVSRPMTRYGERSVMIRLGVTVADCEHTFI